MFPPDASKILADAGFWKARALHAAVRLGVFAALARRPLSTRVLARRLACDGDALGLLLAALGEAGYVARDGLRWGNSAMAARCLVPGAGGDVTAIVLDADGSWQAWGGLPDTIRRGRRPRGRALYDDRARLHELLRACDAVARLGAAEDVIARLDLARAAHLLDVAGGGGGFARAFCRAWPALRVTLFDRPAALALARRALAAEGRRLPIALKAGDYLRTPLGGPYDVVFMSAVLHGESAADCQRLLVRVRRALPRGGRLVVRDLFLDDDGSSRDGAALLGLAMMLYSHGGGVHRRAAFDQWLRRAGFAPAQMLSAQLLVAVAR